MYAAKGKPALDPAENETKSEQHIENTSSSSDSQQTRNDDASTLPADELIASLQSTGMPEYDTSLRRAILKHFAGQKKVLHEQRIAGQKCARCGKTGHTNEGCPDQTQDRKSVV